MKKLLAGLTVVGALGLWAIPAHADAKGPSSIGCSSPKTPYTQINAAGNHSHYHRPNTVVNYVVTTYTHDLSYWYSYKGETYTPMYWYISSTGSMNFTNSFGSCWL